MKKIIFILLFFYSLKGLAQTPETPVTTTVEQQLENITENSEDAETEDDSYLQLLAEYIKHPINLNTADAGTLQELRLLSPMQIQYLLGYRSYLGKFLSIYEIQAVPGFDLATIQKIRPYVIAVENLNLIDAVTSRLSNGSHSIMVRVGQVLEKSKGYKLDSTQATNFYPGSEQRLFLRYKYNFKNLLQYGVVAEKDPGEEFFKGSQKQGFDYYSAHFFLRNAGIVKSLALGDFTVNLGQGLTQWMNLAFKKGPDVLATKRQSSVLRPYNSAGEINFHRGAGITIGKNNWEATIFASYKKLDANFVDTNRLTDDDDYVSSFQTSGYHRTKSEVTDKGVQRQLAFGGNISYKIKGFDLGLNAVQYSFKYPLIKAKDPYNLYALSGKSFGNYSFDYGYTFKNMHFFGEAASTDKKHLAFVQGLLLSVANNVDMSFFYRNISPGYQALYTSAFTENTFPTNEKGFFSGISIRPNNAWRIDAYADMFRFPWLKFQVNSPTNGKEYMLQLSYRPNKVFDIYSRFRSESKAYNFSGGEPVLNPVISQARQNWRTQMSMKLNSTFTLRSRAEMVWFDKKGPEAENGFTLYADVLYKPMMKPFSGNIRLQYFETDGYNSRLYAYENDVLYSYSIPVFYDKGYRYYLNINYDVNKKLSLWAKWAQTVYSARQTVGSGLDEIEGNHKTEVKLQLRYQFGN
ncbi:MAG: helix-hairpin-helix domain-containing protein [Ferruginibacter sp.]